MKSMATRLVLVGCLLLSRQAAAEGRAVDLELVLAADISRSMDLEEAALVRQGFISALRHPDVVAAIERGPLGRIAVTYVEWGDVRYQRARVDWTEVSGAASAAAFAEAIERSSVILVEWTSISGAIGFASQRFIDNGFQGERRIIDVSGDGPNNSGPYVNIARDLAIANGIVINGLPIINERPTVVCVADHAATVSVLHNDAVANALEGKRLLQLGVITADQSRQTASWAEARNIDYLEGSIMGLPAEVRSGRATLVCSGPKTVFDACKGVLSAFGNAEFVSDMVGAAYQFDKTYYPFGYAMMQGFIQGAALAHAGGFSIDAYTRVMTARLSVFPERLERLGSAIADRNHDGDQAAIEVWADTLAKSLSLCRALGVDDTLPAALMQNFGKAMDAGYRKTEISALFECLLPKSG